MNQHTESANANDKDLMGHAAMESNSTSGSKCRFGIGSISNWIEQFRAVRRWSEQLCEPLEIEDFVVQPIADVSPPKWHLGHTTWFFENFVLAKHLPGYELFDERLNWFFNSYYESQGPRILRSNRGNMTRPDVQTVFSYRAHVDEHLVRLLGLLESAANEDKGKETDSRRKGILSLLETGLHHEQQHQELLVTDIKFILGTNPLFPKWSDASCWNQSLTNEASEISSSEFVSPAISSDSFSQIPEGVYECGFDPDKDGNGFCWDNELSQHRCFLHDFEIANRLVTNGEYLQFMRDGGYERFELWQMDGIQWARELETPAPMYWYQKDGDWFQVTPGGLSRVDPSLPVTHISWYEADAFARWSNARLPTEQEWEVACRILINENDEAGNWAESRRFHPSAANNRNQFLGDVWEWTASAYLPYPRYPRMEGALGEYNGKFMINQMVLRGGSCATPQSHIRISYRNFFQPDRRWQFTGVRLARDTEQKS